MRTLVSHVSTNTPSEHVQLRGGIRNSKVRRLRSLRRRNRLVTAGTQTNFTAANPEKDGWFASAFFWRGAGAVVLLLGAIATDMRSPGVRAFMVQHALTASALGAVLALLVGAFAVETWLAARRRAAKTAELIDESKRWAPLVRPFLDSLMPIVMELRSENASAQEHLFEGLTADDDDSPTAQLAREELDMDVECNILRGKALTSGQMPWDGRDEALQHLEVVRRISGQLGRLAATWAGLLAHDDAMRQLLLGLAEAAGQQRDVLEDAVEPDYHPQDAYEAIKSSDERTSNVVVTFIERYALTSNRRPGAVERMFELGEREYIQRKLAAQRRVRYASGELASRPAPNDPDDEVPF
jgi:hypothetical protein